MILHFRVRIKFSTSIMLVMFLILLAETAVAFRQSSPGMASIVPRTTRTVPHVRVTSPPVQTTSSMSSSATMLQARPSTLILRMTALEASVPPPDSLLVQRLRQYASTFCNLFPVWTLLTATIALRRPQTFLTIPASTFPAQIGMLMLCMGITLRPSDFKRVAQRPGAVALAFVGCYGVVRPTVFLVACGFVWVGVCC